MPLSSASGTPSLRKAVRQFVRMLHMIRDYWRPLIKGIWLGSLVGLVGLITPYLSKLLIDEVYPTENTTLMQVLVGGVLAVSLTSAVMGTIQGYYQLNVSTHLRNAVSLKFFNHLQHLPLRFFKDKQVGEVMSRFQDVGKSLGSVTTVFNTLFGQGIYLLLVPPFLVLLQWKLALIALLSLPVTVLITGFSGKLLRRYWKASSEAYADINALQVETLSQIRTLKSLALERHVYKQAESRIEYAIRTQLKAAGFSQVLGLLNRMLYALNTALFTWMGWTLILTKEMTLGSYIAFTMYIGYLYNPLRQIVDLFSNFQQSAVNLGRMFEYLDAPTEQEPHTVYVPPPDAPQRLRGRIELRHVSFGYDADQLALHDVSLNIEPGTTLALVGPSGSGKSTLLRLLMRLEDADEGTVLFDGTAASRLALHALRQQIAVVWQEQSLLKGTVWSNLTLGLDGISREAVEHAVRVCQIEDLILSLPQGFETSIAEWGASLSGGQQQRLALARALIRDTPVLLLDEVTANIDIHTEQALLRALLPYLKEKTVVYVTHRIATAPLADTIGVLQAGHLIGYGSHDTLMKECALYAEMHTLGATQHGTRHTHQAKPVSSVLSSKVVVPNGQALD